MSGETDDDRSAWTTDTLHAMLNEQVAGLRRELENLRSMLEERYATQTKAVDAAFVAQQTAMQTALTSAEKAVGVAQTAAAAAVAKAETAAEKRFDSVNEFRAQLADQATTFIPRAETEARLATLTEKIDSLRSWATTRDREIISRSEATALLAATRVELSSMAEKVDTNALRIEQMRARSGGIGAAWGYLVAVVGVATAIIAAVISLH